MADIPIEKKSGMGWIGIVLVVILLALLAWWLLDDDGGVVEYADDEAVAAAPIVENDMADRETDRAMAGTGMLAVGDRIDLDNLRVTSTLGDNAFTAEVDGENMIVVFDEAAAPDNSVEGRYDIDEGSMVSVMGEVRSVDEPLPDDMAVELPAGMDRYIFADSIEMMN